MATSDNAVGEVRSLYASLADFRADAAKYGYVVHEAGAMFSGDYAAYRSPTAEEANDPRVPELIPVGYYSGQYGNIITANTGWMLAGSTVKS